VELAGGGYLTAVRQNLDGAAADYLGAQGTAIRVAWRDDQTYEITGQAAPGPADRKKEDS
jgi:hypothetical protein